MSNNDPKFIQSKIQKVKQQTSKQKIVLQQKLIILNHTNRFIKDSIFQNINP